MKTRIQKLWIEGTETTRRCADCGVLKNDEFWLVPAPEYGMGDSRVTACNSCIDISQYTSAGEQNEGSRTDLERLNAAIEDIDARLDAFDARRDSNTSSPS